MYFNILVCMDTNCSSNNTTKILSDCSKTNVSFCIDRAFNCADDTNLVIEAGRAPLALIKQAKWKSLATR